MPTVCAQVPVSSIVTAAALPGSAGSGCDGDADPRNEIRCSRGGAGASLDSGHGDDDGAVTNEQATLGQCPDQAGVRIGGGRRWRGAARRRSRGPKGVRWRRFDRRGRRCRGLGSGSGTGYPGPTRTGIGAGREQQREPQRRLVQRPSAGQAEGSQVALHRFPRVGTARLYMPAAHGGRAAARLRGRIHKGHAGVASGLQRPPPMPPACRD